MKRLFSVKTLIATAIAFGAIGATSVAQAREDVQVRIAVGEPNGPYQYRDHQDNRDYRDHRDNRGGYDPRVFRDADRDGIPNLYDRDSRFYDHRLARRHVKWGDFDRDGFVNAFDRAPNNPRRH
jgi:hypothetical protein